MQNGTVDREHILQGNGCGSAARQLQDLTTPHWLEIIGYRL
jgi:hypothetical protein